MYREISCIFVLRAKQKNRPPIGGLFFCPRHVAKYFDSVIFKILKMVQIDSNVYSLDQGCEILNFNCFYDII